MQSKIEELRKYRAKALDGGGEEKRQKQHQADKGTARERLERLLDPGSFIETGLFVTHRSSYLPGVEAPGDGVVTGHGTIHGRTVCVFAQDFTVMGGSLGEMHAQKICHLQDLAMKMGVPIIGVNDSGGARIQEGVDSLNGYGEIFRRNTLASGVIPQIAVIMGPCAGGAVYSPALMDFIFMVDGTSQMFVTGPQVIKAVTGEEVTTNILGGARVHTQVSGVASFYCSSEEDCLEKVRELLTFLPLNNLEDPPLLDYGTEATTAAARLSEVVPVEPNKPYDVRDVLGALLDEGYILEVFRDFSPNMVTGLGRLQGQTVGVVANQPKVLAGCLDINAADKAARFVRFCDCFNIPLITMVDTPGFLPGTTQEHGGIIRHGAKLLYAYSEATVPKLTVITRKAYGGAYLAMCSKSLGADAVWAWPSAEIAVMGPEGAANIIYRREIAEADEPESMRQQMIEKYRKSFAHPYIAASRGHVDGVIEPEETREQLIFMLSRLAGKREGRPSKKHGNIPL